MRFNDSNYEVSRYNIWATVQSDAIKLITLYYYA